MHFMVIMTIVYGNIFTFFLYHKDDPKYDGSSTTESDQGRGNSEAGSFIGSPAVDPLIVKFEEGMRLY